MTSRRSWRIRRWFLLSTVWVAGAALSFKRIAAIREEAVCFERTCLRQRSTEAVQHTNSNNSICVSFTRVDSARSSSVFLKWAVQPYDNQLTYSFPLSVVRCSAGQLAVLFGDSGLFRDLFFHCLALFLCWRAFSARDVLEPVNSATTRIHA